MNPKECQSYAVESIDLLAAYSCDWKVLDMSLPSKRAVVAHLNAAMHNNELYQTKVWEDPKMKYASWRLAGFYQAQGHYADAEKLLGLSIAALQAEVGPEHLETLRMMGNLAIVYDLKGDYSQAQILLEKVLGGIKAQFGDEHIDTLNSMHNLAIIYGRQRSRYGDAERLGKQALEMKGQILGRNDPSTLRSASTLATTYKRLGRYEEAERLFISVLNGIKIGDGSPGWEAALLTCESLALLYTSQRRYGEAEYLFKEILKLREEEFGPEHPETCSTLAGFGHLFKHQNKNAEAAELLLRALEGQKNVLGVDHPATIRTKKELESVQRQQEGEKNEKGEGNSSARTRWRIGSYFSV